MIHGRFVIGKQERVRAGVIGPWTLGQLWKLDLGTVALEHALLLDHSLCGVVYHMPIGLSERRHGFLVSSVEGLPARSVFD